MGRCPLSVLLTAEFIVARCTSAAVLCPVTFQAGVADRSFRYRQEILKSTSHEVYSP